MKGCISPWNSNLLNVLNVPSKEYMYILLNLGGLRDSYMATSWVFISYPFTFSKRQFQNKHRTPFLPSMKNDCLNSSRGMIWFESLFHAKTKH